MPQRFKRPAIWRPLAVSLALLSFQAYLGYSALNGQFGIESQKTMQVEIADLQGQADALQVEIDSYRHKMSLFSADQLDPDIIGERARALLSMSQPDDVIIMVDPKTGEPYSSSAPELPDIKLTDIIVHIPD